MGALIGGLAGFLKATVGVHEVITTIMLNWTVVWVGVFLFGLGGPLQNDLAGVGPDLERHRRGSEAAGLLGRPAPAGAPHRVLHRDRRARRLLDHPQPDDARVRRQGGRLQPGGGALRRHQRRAQLLPRDGDLGRVRRARRRDRHPRLAVPALDRRRRDASVVGFTGIAVALLGRNTALGVGLAALLFGALFTGTSTRNLDPEVFQPELASNLTLLIQGLVVLFVGMDMVVLCAPRPCPAPEGGDGVTSVALPTGRGSGIRCARSHGPASSLGLASAFVALPPISVRSWVPSLLLALLAALAGVFVDHARARSGSAGTRSRRRCSASASPTSRRAPASGSSRPSSSGRRFSRRCSASRRR